jgi:hypothetical protein
MKPFALVLIVSAATAGCASHADTSFFPGEGGKDPGAGGGAAQGGAAQGGAATADASGGAVASAGAAPAGSCESGAADDSFAARCLACSTNACDECLCTSCTSELEACKSTSGCPEIAACIKRSGCRGVDCYCGTFDAVSCAAGQANGPCKSAILDAPGGRVPTLLSPSAGPASDKAVAISVCTQPGHACAMACMQSR